MKLQVVLSRKLSLTNVYPKLGDEQRLLRSKTEIPGLYIAGDWASSDHILSEGAV